MLITADTYSSEETQTNPHLTTTMWCICRQYPALTQKLISLHYSKLCATPITPHPKATQLSKTQCLDLYGKGLGCAADLQQQAVKAATAKARQAAVTEPAEWLHITGIKTMQSATPEDMLVYLTQQWLPNHAGSTTSAGELIAAPSSLSGTKSHLAKEFELLGRTWRLEPNYTDRESHAEHPDQDHADRPCCRTWLPEEGGSTTVRSRYGKL
ncbi:TPA: hypothetical protein ACH3X1_001193 [Trebouxia sp. C0004]